MENLKSIPGIKRSGNWKELKLPLSLSPEFVQDLHHTLEIDGEKMIEDAIDNEIGTATLKLMIRKMRDELKLEMITPSELFFEGPTASLIMNPETYHLARAFYQLTPQEVNYNSLAYKAGQSRTKEIWVNPYLPADAPIYQITGNFMEYHPKRIVEKEVDTTWIIPRSKVTLLYRMHSIPEGCRKFKLDVKG